MSMLLHEDDILKPIKDNPMYAAAYWDENSYSFSDLVDSLIKTFKDDNKEQFSQFIVSYLFLLSKAENNSNGIIIPTKENIKPIIK